MKKKFERLLETRKIIALATTALFIGLACAGVLEVNFIQTMIVTVISYYFGKSTALDKSND